MPYHSEFNPAAVLKRWAALGEFDGVVPVFGLIDKVSGHVVGITSVVFRFDDDLAIDHGQELPRGIDRVSFDDVIIVFLCPNAIFHDPHFLVIVAKGLPNVIVEHKEYKSFHALMLAKIGFAVLAILRFCLAKYWRAFGGIEYLGRKVAFLKALLPYARSTLALSETVPLGLGGHHQYSKLY